MIPGDVRVRRWPVTDLAEKLRHGWLVVTLHPYDPSKPPLIRIGLEPPLEDPAPPKDEAA